MFEHIDRPMFMAAVLTGMRKGELVALRWRDVDFHAARIRVRRNYSCGEFGTPKTRRSTRSIPMTPELADALLALRAISRWRKPDDLVFAHPDHGGPKANIARRFRAALKAGGVDETHRFHDLRHTRDLTTTQRYADYAPSAHEGEMVAAAFARPAPESAADNESSTPSSTTTRPTLVAVGG